MRIGLVSLMVVVLVRLVAVVRQQLNSKDSGDYIVGIRRDPVQSAGTGNQLGGTR